MHILLRSQMRFEKPQGCGCSGGLGLFQGQCHTWNGIMASFTQAGTFWALRMLLDPQGAPGIAAGMVPRSWSQPGCAAVSHQTLTPLPAAGRGGSHRRIPWDSSPSSGFPTPGAAQISVLHNLFLTRFSSAIPAAWEGAGKIKYRGGDACGWLDDVLSQEDPTGGSHGIPALPVDFQSWSSPDFSAAQSVSPWLLCASLAAPVGP